MTLAAARRRCSRRGCEDARALVDGLLVGVPCPGRGGFALALVGLPATGVARRAGLVQTELHDLRDRCREKVAVMGDDDDPAAVRVDQRREPDEAVAVEIVRRLVEEDGIEARHSQRGEPDAGGLAAGEIAKGSIEQVRGQPDLARSRRKPRVGVRAAERQPALDRLGVLVEGLEVTGLEARGKEVDRARGGSDAHALENHLACRRHFRGGNDLGQVADRAEPPHAARVGTLEPREDSQQRRLAGSVRADEADPALGAHPEVDRFEHCACAVVARDLTGVDHGRRHAGLPGERWRRSSGEGTPRRDHLGDRRAAAVSVKVAHTEARKGPPTT